MDSSATDPKVLFSVEGQVAVVTGGGSGLSFYRLFDVILISK